MRFEDPRIWQEARILANMVCQNSEGWRDYSLKDQIRRAAVSVSNNIAEGFEREYDGDFLRFLSIARDSCSEVKSITYLALDQKFFTQEIQLSIYSKADGLGVGTFKLIQKIKARKGKSIYQAKEPEVEYIRATASETGLGTLDSWPPSWIL